jgi:hypothetical protein
LREELLRYQRFEKALISALRKSFPSTPAMVALPRPPKPKPHCLPMAVDINVGFGEGSSINFMTGAV